jgi:hypothetical protein
VADALNLRGFDEIVISTLPWRVSRWLRVDLLSKLRALGVPVHHVTSTPGAGVAAEPASRPEARVAVTT